MGFGNHFQDIKGNEFFCEIDESYLEKFLEGYEYGEGPEEPNFMQQVPDHCYAAEKLSNFSCECSKFCEGPCYYYHEDLAYFDNHVCGGKYEDARPFKCNKREAMLYGLLHARYIMTNAGMEKMEKKHTKGEFGYCPRVYCENQPLLPMGLSDIPKKCTVKMYCPKCEDLYHPRSTRFHSIDGSYFGTSFPHMFLMAFPELRPKPAKFSYEPLLYGFKIHPEAKELQLQKAELANQAKQKEMEQKKKQQVEKANKQEKAKKQEKANKQEKAKASKDQNKENPADKVDDNKAVDKKQEEANVEQETKDKECKAESEKVITVIEQEAKDKECKAESEQVITVIEQEAKDKECKAESEQVITVTEQESKDKECKGEGEKDEGEKESKEVLQKKEILDADKNQAVDRDNKDNKGQDQDNIQKEDISKDNEKETEIAKVAEQQIAEKQEDSGLHKVEEKRLGNEQSEQNPEKNTEDQRAEEISGKKENQLDKKPDENVQEHMDKEEETVATAKDKEESNVDKDMVESSVNIDKVEMSEEVKQRLRRRSKEDELNDQEPPSKTQKHTT